MRHYACAKPEIYCKAMPSVVQTPAVLSAAKTAVKGIADAAAIGTGAIITMQPKPVMPPPRETWTYGLVASCCHDPSFGCHACVCPCLAVERVNSYLKNGHEDGERNRMTVLCAYYCAGDSIAGTRDRVRQKTNMVEGECCSKQCLDSCLTTCLCWGCALAQDRRELQVYFGHAGADAPVHPGTPAAKAQSNEGL